MDIIAAYREVGSYRGAAELCGTTPKTVRRIIERHLWSAETRIRGREHGSRGGSCELVYALRASRRPDTATGVVNSGRPSGPVGPATQPRYGRGSVPTGAARSSVRSGSNRRHGWRRKARSGSSRATSIWAFCSRPE